MGNGGHADQQQVHRQDQKQSPFDEGDLASGRICA
jgi:hypothetical protein